MITEDIRRGINYNGFTLKRLKKTLQYKAGL